MTAFVVRRGLLSDLARVQELNAALFLSDRPHDDDLDLAWPYASAGESYFRDRINGDGACLVAEAHGTVIGYLAAGLREETWRRVVRSELENMYVDERWRRAGVGRALVQAFREWSREVGARQSFVEAYAGNAGAVAFYESCGFAVRWVALTWDDEESS